MDQAAWDERYAGPELVWGAGPNCFVAEELAALEPGRALDLGTGEGRNAIWLAERGWRVTGVDFSAVGLEKAKRLAEARGVSAEWIRADLTDFQPEPRAFDLVAILYLQVQAQDRTTIVRAAAAGVAAGGTLLLVGHHSDNIERGHGGPQAPAVLYSAEDVAADLEGTGLSIQRAEMVERPVPTPDGERIALDALVRARR